MTTAKRRALLSEPGYDFSAPRISPDGRLVACIRDRHDSYDKPGDVTLVVTALDGASEPRDLLDGFDRRPVAAAWAPDSDAPSISPPTTTAGARCSAPTWPPARSPG